MDAAYFWDGMERFHRWGADRTPAATGGLEAVLRLRQMLEPTWKSDSQRRHPLESRLRRSSETNTPWLHHFVQKLERIQQLPSGDDIIGRMGRSDDYLAALSEAEIALKMSLAGHNTTFIPRGNEASPDILGDIDGTSVYIEVTSLNPPDRDRRAIEAVSIILDLAFANRMQHGDVFGRVPGASELDDFRVQVDRAIRQAKREDRKVTANIPGLFKCYFASMERATEIPKAWRGRIDMRIPSRPPKFDLIARKIEDKAGRQLPSSEIGILVIYDRISSSEEGRGHFGEAKTNIENVIGTYPNLAGVILIHPFTSYPPDSQEPLAEGDRVYLQTALPDGEAETIVGWSNPLDHHKVFGDIIESFAAFPGYLSRLLEKPG